jgi:hypothetical protein
MGRLSSASTRRFAQQPDVELVKVPDHSFHAKLISYKFAACISEAHAQRWIFGELE